MCLCVCVCDSSCVVWCGVDCAVLVLCRGDVKYSEIGGLGEQIRELREVVEL